MTILLTNDDGYQAPGLRALARLLGSHYEVEVVAPDREQSGTGHGITVARPLRVHQVQLEGARRAWAVDGTPVDCVKLAVDAILEAPPQLVISGINRGANLGNDVFYSGTVAAALEGTMLGLNAMAVSLDLDSAEEEDYHNAARASLELAGKILEQGLPPETLLNVNVPGIKTNTDLKIEVTRLGRRIYKHPVVACENPRGECYYWIAGRPVDIGSEPGTDTWAVQNGSIAVTPVHLDATNQNGLEDLRRWKLEELKL